jgi:hypothetical protein
MQKTKIEFMIKTTEFGNEVLKENAYNRRVGSGVGQCSLFESSDSNSWSVCFWLNHSDSAAHAKHYILL